MSTFRKIADYSRLHEASFAKTFLESHDIPAFVKDDRGPFPTHIKLMVPEELADEAIALLKNSENFSIDDIPWDQTETDPETQKPLPKEKMSSNSYSRSFLWVLMPFIAAAIAVVIGLIAWFGISNLIRFISDAFNIHS